MLHYRNAAIQPKEVRIRKAHHKGWEIIGLPDYHKFKGKVDFDALPRPDYPVESNTQN